MAKTLAEFRTKLDALLQDKAGVLSQGDKDRFIQGDAVAIYSKDRPQIKRADYSGDGTLYMFDVPSDWIEDFSRIESVEYPQGNDPADYLEDNDWVFYRTVESSVEKLKIRLLGIIPTAGQTMRVIYTTLHSIPTSATGTIPDADFDAVANLAASLCCRALATKYAQSSESTIGADSVDWADKGRLYTELADKLLTLYREHVGRGEDVKAAGKIQDMDTSYAWGADFMFHPRKWR